MRNLTLLFVFLATPVWAHEFWLEPLAYQIPADGRLEAEIVNGQEFAGLKLAYIPQRIASYAVFAGAAAEPVEMRIGTTPGLQTDPVGEGLNIVIYQSTIATVDYEDWAKFQRFVDHKDLPVTLSDHLARNLPQINFKEAYTRFSKTLIGVGTALGEDRRTGLETELVALTNPYTDDLSGGLRVQLFYRENLRADEQIEVFDKAPDGTVTIFELRTDAEGIAAVPVISGHSYMLDAVVLREPNDELAGETGAVYETLWANLTFAAP